MTYISENNIVLQHFGKEYERKETGKKNTDFLEKFNTAVLSVSNASVDTISKSSEKINR